MEKKLAVFVEGRTEFFLLERMLYEIAGRHNIRIDAKEIRGGTTIPVKYNVIRAAKNQTTEKYYVMIFDCGSDLQVAQRIREEHVSLTNNGYVKIIGIRVVSPGVV